MAKRADIVAPGALAGVLFLVAPACEEKKPAPPERAVWEIAQSEKELEQGRVIWLANCKRCHAHGTEGAPRIGDRDAWQPRVGGQLSRLVQNVITGVQGKAGGEMPARAGNETLTDDEIKAAVSFMVAASR